MEQPKSIWGSDFRGVTLGIIFVVTAVAFEGLAVTTIAPGLSQELHGGHLYGWVFSAYLLAQLVGTVITGQWVDRIGPAKPFIVSISVFAIGILIAALAPGMLVLILGRILQGYGAGALINCVYTAITIRFDDSLRPQILAVFSSAYILPGLVGPYIAGLIAEHLSWRYVFWCILPFIFMSALLTTPAFRGLRASQGSDPKKGFLPSLLLAAGTGILITGLGKIPSLYGFILSLAGLVLLVFPLKKLLPEGTLLAREGLPATIASRGLFVAAYFGTQTYLVLALTALTGFSADTAGFAVASAAISWSLAANLQARLDKKDQGTGRRKRVLLGLTCMLLGVSATVPQGFITSEGFAFINAIVSQIVMGFGIGLAHPTSGAIAFSHVQDGEGGKVSSTLTVADTFTPAVGIGIGGAMIAMMETLKLSLGLGIFLALALQALIVVTSLIAATRLRGRESIVQSATKAEKW
ncbi:MFS transporter [Brevibacillus ruminantium]|uniref:MFS transporter n=1 Tax=Brevibacillus ruminantium TaxID=2950604 RepID=A0ABY4WBE6_9BACL|nr:MFS transporter [Brevibacillus ruminantium]USG64357.1 MFS transporter [Brevibacillus ruminantium]